MAIHRAVPNLRADRPAEARQFFVELLGFEVAMDLDWVVTLASPGSPAAQVTIISNDDPAAPGISIEVDDVDRVHERALERRLEIAYPLRDEEWAFAASCCASRGAR
jgi:catechol 2,3-dioxygenase-like lactoylglutathione lyase family enzyme